MVICTPDDGWRNHPKHVEQFTDKINCVQLHLVGYLLTQNYEAWSHEHKNPTKLVWDRCTLESKELKVLGAT